MAELALRTWVRVIYAGRDISADLAPYLEGVSYTDNEQGKADDLSITLNDTEGKWRGPWMPARGDTLSVTIMQDGRGAGPDLPCGKFTIDEMTASGPPSTFVIKGVSVPLDSSARRQQKCRAWENVRLSEIAADVAKTAGVRLLWLASGDPLLDRRDQRDESDLKFLQRLATDEALAVKCSDDQLVVFSPEEMQGRPAVATIVIGQSNVMRWSFGAQSHDVYACCTLEYMDAASGEVKKYTYNDPLITQGKTKKLVKRAPSIGEAERQARAALFNSNRAEVDGSITLLGDTRLVAGSSINVLGAGRYDGKYYIESAVHNVVNGYTTEIKLQNVRKPSEDPNVHNTPSAEGELPE